MKWALTILLLLHALIHLMGFAKAFNLAEINELTLRISRPMGTVWLLSGLLFIVTAVLLIKNEVWWMPGIPALVLSQVLIVIYWQDAKFGTLGNVILLVVAIFAYASWSFQRHNQLYVNELLQYSKNNEKPTVTPDMLQHLPPIIQKWLNTSNIIGTNVIKAVHLEQVGEMRTSLGGKWMPVHAEQWFTTEAPGFLWLADVTAAPGIKIKGRDRYLNGEGHMLIKLMSLFPVANAHGPETDQGALLRYLAEIIWFPSAALSKQIQWEPLDSSSAKATMQYGHITDSGIFRFNPEGQFRSFEAWRYYDRKEGATLENWHIEADPKGYRKFNGILVPARAEVTWKLKEGDFTWFKLEIKELAFNNTHEAHSDPLDIH